MSRFLFIFALLLAGMLFGGSVAYADTTFTNNFSKPNPGYATHHSSLSKTQAACTQCNCDPDGLAAGAMTHCPAHELPDCNPSGSHSCSPQITLLQSGGHKVTAALQSFHPPAASNKLDGSFQTDLFKPPIALS